MNGERVLGAQRTVETVRLLGPIRRDRWTVASYTDARTTRERTVSHESFFLKRTERRFTASFFERLETWRMMLGAMGRRRSRAEAMMMMAAKWRLPFRGDFDDFGGALLVLVLALFERRRDVRLCAHLF